MTRRIKKDLDKIKKSYALERKTVVDDVKEAVFVKAPIKEQQLYFVMDRFGYAKTLDANTYHRNQEAVQKDYRYVISCLNTDKLCFFTDMGIMHQLKVLDIPAGRLRDKGTPLDNLCKYDSSQETVLTFLPAQKFNNTRLLFVTTQSMTKIVDGSEFLVTKKTVSATKLSEQDRLLCVKPIDQEVEDQTIVFETEQGIFLKFLLSEIPTKKKAAIGVRGMKLQGDDQIKRIYLPEEEAIPSIDYKGKTLEFHRLKLASRDGKGSKVRR